VQEAAQHPTYHLRGAFGDDAFGRFAEHAARFLGTPQYIVGQTIVVAIWIVLNGIFLVHPFDVYPFVLLNLVFSTQAAYAAPLILLAQTRQADRDKIGAEKAETRHTKLETAAKRETDMLVGLLDTNTKLTQEDKDLTEQIAALTREIHTLLTKNGA
jgi:uncharacterized membrane protein